MTRPAAVGRDRRARRLDVAGTFFKADPPATSLGAPGGRALPRRFFSKVYCTAEQEIFGLSGFTSTRRSFEKHNTHKMTRAQDSEAEIARRMETAEQELREAQKFDYILESRSREEDFSALLEIWRKTSEKIWIGFEL